MSFYIPIVNVNAFDRRYYVKGHPIKILCFFKRPSRAIPMAKLFIIFNTTNMSSIIYIIHILFVYMVIHSVYFPNNVLNIELFLYIET